MDAFEEMYETCSQRVYLFLYKLCKSPDIAEELTQETFYQAILSFHRFQGKCDIFTWLASIAKHVYYKYLKKNRLGFDIISIDLINDLWPDSIDGPEELIQNSDVCNRVKHTLSKLPQKYRDVVILRIYAEMAFAQIGIALGISENSAKVIFFRAKKMLAKELCDEFDM